MKVALSADEMVHGMVDEKVAEKVAWKVVPWAVG